MKYKHINSHLQTLQRHQMLHANMLMIGTDYWLAWLYLNHLALPLRGWMKGSPLKKDEPSSPSCLGLLSAEVLPPGKQGRQRNHCNQHILIIIHIKTKGWDKKKGFLLVRLPLNSSKPTFWFLYVPLNSNKTQHSLLFHFLYPAYYLSITRITVFYQCFLNISLKCFKNYT